MYKWVKRANWYFCISQKCFVFCFGLLFGAWFCFHVKFLFDSTLFHWFQFLVTHILFYFPLKGPSLWCILIAYSWGRDRINTHHPSTPRFSHSYQAQGSKHRPDPLQPSNFLAKTIRSAKGWSQIDPIRVKLGDLLQLLKSSILFVVKQLVRRLHVQDTGWLHHTYTRVKSRDDHQTQQRGTE